MDAGEHGAPDHADSARRADIFARKIEVAAAHLNITKGRVDRRAVARRLWLGTADYWPRTRVGAACGEHLDATAIRVEQYRVAEPRIATPKDTARPCAGIERGRIGCGIEVVERANVAPGTARGQIQILDDGKCDVATIWRPHQWPPRDDRSAWTAPYVSVVLPDSRHSAAARSGYRRRTHRLQWGHWRQWLAAFRDGQWSNQPAQTKS